MKRRANLQLIFPDFRAPPVSRKKLLDSARRAADFLKALAHENRLVILCMLSQGEKSVSQLEEILSVRQPNVSQQLARLRADGLVRARREGKTIYYTLASDPARVVVGAVYEIFCGAK